MQESFTVLVPVYNDSKLVLPSLERISMFMNSWSTDYEILVVESGSTDGSAGLCDEAGARWPRVRVIHEPVRTGYGSAMRLGIANAKRKFIWIVTLDLPFPLESVFAAHPLLDAHDAVLSYRSSDPRGLFRRFQSLAYNLLLRVLLGLNARHANSAFKVLRLSTVRAIPLVSTGWFIDAELRYRLQERGVTCAEIGVPLIDRSAGTSTVRFATWIGVLRELLRFRALLRTERSARLPTRGSVSSPRGPVGPRPYPSRVDVSRLASAAGRTACPACGIASEHVSFYRVLQKCVTCGFVSFAAENVDFAQLYDDSYFAGGEYADYRGQEPAIRKSMRRHLDQMARYASGGDLLEVGCAYGYFLDEARRRFATVKGIDIAEGAVAHAREHLGLDASVADFPALSETRQYDVVCMWDTLEHVPGPDVFVAKARDVLRPGGHLFITTGDIGSLNARWRGATWRQIHPPTHVNYFSRATLVRMLERLGFRVAGVETASYYHTLHDVAAILALRGGTMGRVGGAIDRVLGPRLADRLGFWVDLRDILFVAARAPSALDRPSA